MRVAHLNMIQSVISRMSGFSAGVKNYCLVVVVALVGLYSQRPNEWLLAIAVVALVWFAYLDAHYLRLERAVRRKFDAVRRSSLDAECDFDVAADEADKPSFTEVAKSWSIRGFYLPLFVGLLVVPFVLRAFK